METERVQDYVHDVQLLPRSASSRLLSVRMRQCRRSTRTRC